MAKRDFTRLMAALATLPFPEMKLFVTGVRYHLAGHTHGTDADYCVAIYDAASELRDDARGGSEADD